MSSAPEPEAVLTGQSGLSVGVYGHRLHDDFGVGLSIVSPRMLDNHLALRLEGGANWYPDLRGLPEYDQEIQGDSRARYWNARLLLEASLPLTPIAGRMYAAIGPQFLLLPSHLSKTTEAYGVYGVVGMELFAGGVWSTFPISVFFEGGGTASTGKADVASRTNASYTIGRSVERPVATGFAMTIGFRYYFWR